jgi:hypothetical protein
VYKGRRCPSEKKASGTAERSLRIVIIGRESVFQFGSWAGGRFLNSSNPMPSKFPIGLFLRFLCLFAAISGVLPFRVFSVFSGLSFERRSFSPFGFMGRGPFFSSVHGEEAYRLPLDLLGHFSNSAHAAHTPIHGRVRTPMNPLEDDTGIAKSSQLQVNQTQRQQNDTELPNQACSRPIKPNDSKMTPELPNQACSRSIKPNGTIFLLGPIPQLAHPLK